MKKPILRIPIEDISINDFGVQTKMKTKHVEEKVLQPAKKPLPTTFVEPLGVDGVFIDISSWGSKPEVKIPAYDYEVGENYLIVPYTDEVGMIQKPVFKFVGFEEENKAFYQELYQFILKKRKRNE